MKVLVTGGSGFVGKRVVAHLKKLGWEVLAPGHRELDITDGSALGQWFREHRPEAVIHTAAVSDTGVCQRNPEASQIINVTGTVNLVAACREIGAKPVICSSDQVYFGSCQPGPHREDEVVSPGNVYGFQKLRAERLCLEILPETVCLRLSWMYARDTLPGDRGHFLQQLKDGLADPEKILSWPVHDRRGLTDVESVVKNLPKALTLPGGIWNFGSPNDRSTHDTVKQLLEELGREDVLQRLKPNEEAFTEDPRDLSMDLSKLRSAGILFPTTGEGLHLALAESR